MQIRGWLARKHLLHQEHQAGGQAETPPMPHHPFAFLRGKQAQVVLGWEGRCRACPLSILSSSLLLSLPFSVQYRQCIQPSRGLKGKGGETVHSGRGKGVRKRGSEDVLLIEVARGLFTGFWESQGGSCCYCCWWNLEVLWCEPCRTGKEMQGKQLPPGMLPLAVSRSHKPLPLFALIALFSCDHLTNGVWRPGELPKDWGCQIHDFPPS